MCVHHITSWKRFDIIHIRVTTSHSPNLLYNCREGQMFRKFFQFILVDVWSNQCIEIQIRWCLNQFQTRRTIQYSISPCLDKHHSEHLVRSQKKENLYYHMMMHSLSWTFFRVLNKLTASGPGHQVRTESESEPGHPSFQEPSEERSDHSPLMSPARKWVDQRGDHIYQDPDQLWHFI